MYLVYTWMGETAAAGAVRTGMPLSGLLGEECIWSVWAGPSERPRYKATELTSHYTFVNIYIILHYVFVRINTKEMNVFDRFDFDLK